MPVKKRLDPQRTQGFTGEHLSQGKPFTAEGSHCGSLSLGKAKEFWYDYRDR
jgi:hypothetical protein